MILYDKFIYVFVRPGSLVFKGSVIDSGPPSVMAFYVFYGFLNRFQSPNLLLIFGAAGSHLARAACCQCLDLLDIFILISECLSNFTLLGLN